MLLTPPNITFPVSITSFQFSVPAFRGGGVVPGLLRTVASFCACKSAHWGFSRGFELLGSYVNFHMLRPSI